MSYIRNCVLGCRPRNSFGTGTVVVQWVVAMLRRRQLLLTFECTLLSLVGSGVIGFVTFMQVR